MIHETQSPVEGLTTTDNGHAEVSESPDVHMATAALPVLSPAVPPDPDVSERRQEPRKPITDRRRAPRSAKAQFFVTFCHWSMTILLALNLLTGMRIGWGFVESPLGGMSGVWGTMLTTLAPQGTLFGINIITFHVMSAFFMLLVGGVYAGYMWCSGASRRIQVTTRDVQNLWSGLRSGHFWRHKPALWGANVLSYWVSFLFIGVLVVTGVALYRLDWGLAEVLGGYSLMRLLHAMVSYLLIPYVVLHMLLQWFFGRFWTIFKAGFYRPHMRAGLVCLALAIPVTALLYWGDAQPTDTLTVQRISGALAAPVLDGDGSDPVWSQAESVVVTTAKGVNNPHDTVDVHVKALHDGERIYFQFQWDDPDVSYKRFPLLKTAEGWKVLQTAFAQADESVYYEDKFSMYITDVANGSCAATCHLGVGPASAKGLKHGLHYTTGGEVGDLWHWKAVRTNPMGDLLGEPGYLDDQHFRAPEPVPAEIKERYTGGYFADSSSGGGYSYNFVRLDPKKSLFDTYVTPKMLPPSNTIAPNPDAATSEQGVTWWIHKSQGIPYTPEADTYPVGTLNPNILIEPFQGDRADVRAKGAWRDGRWTVETQRVLDTKSAYDVAFVPGKPVYITVATYNRTQTRHGEHIKPVRVVLE